ncbi:hypothetical protein [uncultured Halomonas sp.]|uniref:hypothetical protein n=1 Tax=uncultured Halomonas sp. TaxID=173971 RepID=UPI0026356931|nr:hypothetical protein [uncultured Halomonas sp.]
MTTDDILESYHNTTFPTHHNLDEARRLLRDHEAWASLDALTQEIDAILPDLPIHFLY